MSTSPAISVIVPVYNVERYLAECLDSIVAQTHESFEVVVVDDGSTDSSSAIIEHFAAEHPVIIRSLSKPNGGLSDARNYGIDHSSGEYLAFVDADDLIAPNMLASLHERALATGAELVLCGMENFTDGEDSGIHYPEPDMSVFGHSLAEEPRLLYRVDASACDKLCARGLFERSGIRFPVGLKFEDVPTTYRLLPHANRVEKIDEPYYRYRHSRPESISGGYDERYLDLIEGFRLIDVSYRDSGILEANRSGLLRLHLTHLIAGRYPDLLYGAAAGFRRSFIAQTFSLLDQQFPGWASTDVARMLWRNLALRTISTRPWILRAFCRLPSRAYFGLLNRLGAFDANR